MRVLCNSIFIYHCMEFFRKRCDIYLIILHFTRSSSEMISCIFVYINYTFIRSTIFIPQQKRLQQCNNNAVRVSLSHKNHCDTAYLDSMSTLKDRRFCALLTYCSIFSEPNRIQSGHFIWCAARWECLSNWQRVFVITQELLY